MKNKVVGALVMGAWVAFLISGCSGPERNFSGENRGGAQNGGASAGGDQARGGSQASGGRPALAGMGGAGNGSGAAPSDAGAGGEAGTSCQGNECDSCAGATPAPGATCGECGKYVCNADQKSTSCADPKFNACGGCGKLAAAPDTACGDCGKYECAADKESVTCKDPGKNACGGCGVLASAPNSSCGSCGDWQCTTDKTSVKCSGVNANACGGCGTLANAPGGTCGQCGKYECSTDKASTACKDPGLNACGGCSVLTGTLNAACGSGNCGKLVCSSDKNSLTCSGATPNSCGGCGTLTPSGATKGGSCGSCSGTWACNADLNSLSCAGPTPNACGGCTAISGTLGASCGACSVTACASDKNSLVCNSQCSGTQVCVSGLNQCKTPDCSAADSCGKSDGAGSTCTNTKGKCVAKPNSTGQCAGSSCAYTCKSKTLSCSTAAEPACGTWDFESKTAEGWAIDTTAYGVNDAADKTKGLYLAAPPGSGAGSYSLALDVDGTTGKNGTAILIALCPGSAATTGIFGKFHASVWWKPSDTKGKLGGPGYAYAKPDVGGQDVNCPAGEWFDVPTQAIGGVNVTHIGVSIGGIDGHKGTLYFDNIYFE